MSWLIDCRTFPRTLWDIHRALWDRGTCVWTSSVVNASHGARANRTLDHNILSISSKINENHWKSMKIIGNQWKSLKFNGNPSVFTYFYGSAWLNRRLAQSQRAASATPDVPSRVPANPGITWGLQDDRGVANRSTNHKLWWTHGFVKKSTRFVYSLVFF